MDEGTFILTQTKLDVIHYSLTWLSLSRFQGGEPDIPTVAKMVLNDFQRGKLPYYVKPEGADTTEEGKDDQVGNSFEGI